MLIAFLVASADPPAARDIAIFCHDAAPCIARQKQALKHFIGITVMFDAPQSQAERCMRSGKIGKHIDWVKSEACMRAWSNGRKPLLGPGDYILCKHGRGDV